jgi:phospholipase C
VPNSAALRVLTAQVAKNNFYTDEHAEKDEAVMNFVRSKIKHVIYIVKENRTFDQILGDLANGARGDSSLTQFGAAITPNFHRLATKFVTAFQRPMADVFDINDLSLWRGRPRPRQTAKRSETNSPGLRACLA